MKGFLAISCILMLIPLACLATDPIQLPDVEIEGTSNLRTFIYKRDFFPLLADSTLQAVPAFYPTLLLPKPSIAQRRYRTASISADISSNLYADINYSLYDTDGFLDMMKHRFIWYQPQDSFSYLQTELYYRILSRGDFAHNFSANYTQSDFLIGEWKSAGAIYHHQLQKPQLWGLSAKYFRTNVGMQYIQNKAVNEQKKRLSPEVNHLSILKSKNMEFDQNILLSYRDPGISFSIKHSHWQNYSFVNNLGLGFVADKNHLFPALNFDHEIVPSLSSSFQVSNNAHVDQKSFAILADMWNWAILPEDTPLTKTPLDLRISYTEKSHTKLLYLFDYLKVSNQTLWQFDLPVQDAGADTLHATLAYREVLSNHFNVDTKIVSNSDVYSTQYLKICYSDQRDYQHYRLPYKPLVKTGIASFFREGKLTYMMGLDLSLNLKDHNNEYLNDIANLNGAVFFDPTANSSFSIELHNILDTPQYVFRGLPPQKFRAKIICHILF